MYRWTVLWDAFHCSLLTDLLNQSLLDGKYASTTCMVHPSVSTTHMQIIPFLSTTCLVHPLDFTTCMVCPPVSTTCMISPPISTTCMVSLCISTTCMISPSVSTQFLVNREASQLSGYLLLLHDVQLLTTVVSLFNYV